MKLSIVVPAFNEEKEIAACLASIQNAWAAVSHEHLLCEVIVVDNNSTDKTSDLARVAGAKVVFEPINQISRARNLGAAAATGDWILFIDADSRLAALTLNDLLMSISLGDCAGGGCVIALEPVPWWAQGLVCLWNMISRSMHWAAGSFIFCHTVAFREIGGFSEELYAAEEVGMSRRLKVWATARKMKVVILNACPHTSSGRKFELYGKGEVCLLCWRALTHPVRLWRQKSYLSFFYDNRR